MLDKVITQSQCDNLLLEAVRKITSQKQSSTTERIINAVRILECQASLTPINPIYSTPVRSQLILADQVQRSLRQAVEKGILLRRLSKGVPTFRIPSIQNYWKLNLTNPPEDTVVSKLITRVMAELSEVDPGATQMERNRMSVGFTLQTIQEYVYQSNFITYPSNCEGALERKQLVNSFVEKGLEEEERQGTVIKLAGHYNLLKFCETSLSASVTVTQKKLTDFFEKLPEITPVKDDTNEITAAKPELASIEISNLDSGVPLEGIENILLDSSLGQELSFTDNSKLEGNRVLKECSSLMESSPAMSQSSNIRKHGRSEDEEDTLRSKIFRSEQIEIMETTKLVDGLELFQSFSRSVSTLSNEERREKRRAREWQHFISYIKIKFNV